MGMTDINSREAVLAAMAECDRLGRDQFLERYGFGHSREFPLIFQGRIYDSKAILGAAHRFQFPKDGPLRANQFSGGKAGAAGHLVKLGFDIEGVRPGAKDWTLKEVEAVVADYFAMLKLELAGATFSKRQHREALLPFLRERSPSAVERKHQNISAVLARLELPYIDGYKPLGNAQKLLEAVVVDYASKRSDIFETFPTLPAQPGVAPNEVFVDPPRPASRKAVAKQRRAVRVDFAEREASNRQLGQSGEEWVFNLERSRLSEAGRHDLAKKVAWVSRDVGDGLGYDVKSFETNGGPLFIEVKTTNGGRSSPFLVSQNEVEVSKELGSAFSLYRVHEFAKAPKVYRLRGPIEKSCSLEATTWRATVKAR